ncbi:MAG TPA: GNAT family N-acetyltransferase [Solirubrobacteraceae bacterium]|jgi:CelD/BcsL family acetyltransferase involved in cellulose biosynthesis|nr:GNAT family N-acetyltransferase [Solirubrobacteraceae bacterium]
MSVRRIPLADLGDAELDRWRRLAAAAIEPNPFFEPEYVLAQARALDAVGDVALAVVADGDDWTACMPVRRVRSWHRIPIASVSTWRGSAALPSLVGTPLLAAPEAAAALVRGLVATPGSSFVALEWLVADGPAYGPISDAIAHSGLRWIEFERLERAFLTRRPQDDYFERSMKGKHRGVMRRRWKKLDAQLGGEPQVVDVTADPAAVEKLIEIEGASRLAAGGMVLRADPAYEQFFREMCAGFAAAGRLQLHALRYGDQTLAIRCNLLTDPGIFYFKVAYDEAFAEFSPGIRLEVESFHLFHERAQSEWVDSCSDPNNETMNRLLPERRALVTLVLVKPGLRSPLTGAALRAGQGLREGAMARSQAASAANRNRIG